MAPLPGSCLFLWKLIFYLNWFYFSTSLVRFLVFANFIYLFLSLSNIKKKNRKKICCFFLFAYWRRPIPTKTLKRTSPALKRTHAYRNKEPAHLCSTLSQLRASAHPACICGELYITCARALLHRLHQNGPAPEILPNLCVSCGGVFYFKEWGWIMNFPFGNSNASPSCRTPALTNYSKKFYPHEPFLHCLNHFHRSSNCPS